MLIVLIVATPVGASNKILNFSGSLLFYNKSLLRAIWTVVIKCDLPTPAPTDINLLKRGTSLMTNTLSDL